MEAVTLGLQPRFDPCVQMAERRMMRNNRFMPWPRAISAIGTVLFAASQCTHASHNRVDFDFDSSDISGWSSGSISSHVFGPGHYLGAFSADNSATLAIMDALPAELGTTNIIDNGSRLAILTYDMANPSSSAPYELSVLANGDFVTTAPVIPAISTPVTATFVLDSDGPGSSDLLLEFYPTGGVSPWGWGIDNATVDWSRAIPAPGTGICALLSPPHFAFFGERERQPLDDLAI